MIVDNGLCICHSLLIKLDMIIQYLGLEGSEWLATGLHYIYQIVDFQLHKNDVLPHNLSVLSHFLGGDFA